MMEYPIDIYIEFYFNSNKRTVGGRVKSVQELVDLIRNNDLDEYIDTSIDDDDEEEARR